MNARPSIFLPASEEADLIVSRWQRQSEELLLARLYGAPEAGEELDDDPPPEAPEPYVLSPRQEAAEYHAEEEINQRQYEEAE
jgi:hypothetical protein